MEKLREALSLINEFFTEEGYCLPGDEIKIEVNTNEQGLLKFQKAIYEQYKDNFVVIESSQVTPEMVEAINTIKFPMLAELKVKIGS